MMPPELTQNLTYQKNGVWTSSQISSVSYPDQAHQRLVEIENNSFWFKHRNNCIITILKRFPPTSYVLDVGGGNGYVSLAIQQAGYEVVMLESGFNGVLNARNRGLKDILHTTFEDAKFPEDSVGSIGLFDVLEHIKEDEAFLRMISRCMKKAERLYMTVPAHRYLWSSTDVRAKHFRRYSIQSLKKLLFKTDFRVRYVSYFFSGLSIPIFLFRTLPTLLKLPENNSNKKRAGIHKEKRGLAGRILDRHWRQENARLKTGIIFHGASIILVAEPLKP